MKIKFWGVRGSTPTPERRNARYGGNTPCIEVRLANETLIVLDCGSGFRSLGKSLQREFGARPIHGYLFLTHFHWDHIQGIPFFAPLYSKGNIFLFHSVMRRGAELQGAIEDQMTNPYFPVDMGAMGAARHFFDLDETPINVGGAVISSTALHHPQGCVAYKVAADGGIFVFATDTEPGSPQHDEGIREFVKGADVLVYDAQFTPEQLQGEKRGWGHSSWLEGTRIARECGVRQLVLFHHDPDSDDLFVDGLVKKAQQEFPNTAGSAEGLEIYVPHGRMSWGREATSSSAERRRERRFQIGLPLRLCWKTEDGETVQAEAQCKDLSGSGIKFVAPADTPSDGPIKLEMVLPDELTHRGDLSLCFLASPLRKEFFRNPAGSSGPCVIIGAQLRPLDGPQLEESESGAVEKEQAR